MCYTTKGRFFMKKFLTKMFTLMSFVAFMLTSSLQAQSADDILGDWYLPEEKSEGVVGEPIAQIFKQDGKYYAYGFALKDKSGNVTSDIEGVSEAEKTEILDRMVFLAHLRFEDGKWVDGILYSTKNQRYFYVTITMSADKNKLFVEVAQKKGSRYSRTLEWTRATANYSKYKPSMSEVLQKIPAEPKG